MTGRCPHHPPILRIPLRWHSAGRASRPPPHTRGGAPVRRGGGACGPTRWRAVGRARQSRRARAPRSRAGGWAGRRRGGVWGTNRGLLERVGVPRRAVGLPPRRRARPAERALPSPSRPRQWGGLPSGGSAPSGLRRWSKWLRSFRRNEGPRLRSCGGGAVAILVVKPLAVRCVAVVACASAVAPPQGQRRRRLPTGSARLLCLSHLHGHPSWCAYRCTVLSFWRRLPPSWRVALPGGMPLHLGEGRRRPHSPSALPPLTQGGDLLAVGRPRHHLAFTTPACVARSALSPTARHRFICSRAGVVIPTPREPAKCARPHPVGKMAQNCSENITVSRLPKDHTCASHDPAHAAFPVLAPPSAHLRCIPCPLEPTFTRPPCP